MFALRRERLECSTRIGLSKAEGPQTSGGGFDVARVCGPRRARRDGYVRTSSASRKSVSTGAASTSRLVARGRVLDEHRARESPATADLGRRSRMRSVSAEWTCGVAGACGPRRARGDGYVRTSSASWRSSIGAPSMSRLVARGRVLDEHRARESPATAASGCGFEVARACGPRRARGDGYVRTSSASRRIVSTELPSMSPFRREGLKCSTGLGFAGAQRPQSSGGG